MRSLFPVALLCLSCATAPLVERRDDILQRAASYDVEILRDTWGVPHVFGKRDVDAVYGLAWAQSEDDFRTTEEILLATRGRLARVKGADAAPTDYLVRLLDVWGTVERGWPTMSAEARAVAEAYADGVNHYAATHREEVEAPFLYPVTGQDIVAGFIFKMPLFFGLDTTLKELFREARARPVGLIPSEMPRGSNAMAVSRTRSDDDTTRLFVNSHQPWSGPVTWYEAHLVSEEGLDVAGGTFPGAPVILHGFNRNLGWAFTVNQPDLIDVFVLEENPDHEDQYKHDGAWLDLEKSMAKLEVNILGFVITVEREVLRSVHGPVVRRPHGLYAIRYAGVGEAGHLDQWLRMNKAGDFDQWREAMRMQAIPSLNAVYADKEGHVAYFYNAKLPRRVAGPDYTAYLPGDDPRLVWTDHYRFDEVPQVIDPPSGVVFNSNNHPFLATTGDANLKREDYPSSVESRMTNRARRSHALFSVEGPISKARLIAIKHDKTYDPASIFGRARDEALALNLDEPELKEAQALLRSWDLTTTKDNRAAALGVATGYTYYSARYDPFHPVDVEGSLRAGVRRLMKHFGRIDPTWGEVNRLRHGKTDLPLDGGPDILRAVTAITYAEDGRHVGQVGDSLIILAEWGPDGVVRAESIHQYGSATLDEDSPHYGDQAKLFAQEKYKRVWLTREEIEANLERRYRPGEAATAR